MDGRLRRLPALTAGAGRGRPAGPRGGPGPAPAETAAGASGHLSGWFSLPAGRPRVSSRSCGWMGRTRMEEQWWKGELAADIHRTLRTKVGSHFVSPLPSLCPARFAPRQNRPGTGPRLRLGGGDVAFGRSPRSGFARSPRRGSVQNQTCESCYPKVPACNFSVALTSQHGVLTTRCVKC